MIPGSRSIIVSDFSTMPKAKTNKRSSAAKNPYADAAAKTKAASSVFRMNTDIGQHVLKNPGIAQAIVDKAELKQSDVGPLGGMRLYIEGTC